MRTSSRRSSLDLVQVRAFVDQLIAEAGERLRQEQRTAPIREKAQGDWFSELDLALEHLIRQRTAAAYAGIGFLGEESGSAGSQDLMWVVDPIDGSMNFLRGLPHYAISIALVDRGEPVVGCVLDPVRRELFSAARGFGATCNGRRLAVADTAEMMQAVAATVFPKPRSSHMQSYQPRLARVLDSVAGVRRSGSMALDLAYLAAGRLDLFWSQGMGAWDAAAGVLLIREAGGEVLTLDEQPWMSSQAVAAAVPPLAQSWRSLLSAS